MPRVDAALALGLEGDVAHLVGAMAGLRTAAPAPDQVLRLQPGWDAIRLGRAIAACEGAGLLSRWDHPGGVTVVLTAWAADRLGLRLVGGEAPATTTGRFAFRWIPASARPRPAARAGRGDAGPRVVLESDLGPDEAATLGGLADPVVYDHAGRVEAIEWVERQGRAADGGPPSHILRGLVTRGVLRSTHLIGVRRTWSGEQYGEGACDCCGDGRLGELEACIRCNRSGLDHFLGSVPPKLRRPEPSAGKSKGRKARGRAAKGAPRPRTGTG